MRSFLLRRFFAYKGKFWWTGLEVVYNEFDSEKFFNGSSVVGFFGGIVLDSFLFCVMGDSFEVKVVTA